MKIEYKKTSIENVRVQMSTSGDGTLMYAQAVSRDGHIPIDGCNRHQRTIDASGIEACAKYLAAIVVNEYRQNRRMANAMAPSEPAKNAGIFSAAYNDIVRKGCLDEICNSSWAESTRRKSLSYFRANVLPRMDVYGHDICNEDIVTIVDELVEKALKSGNSNNNIETAKNSVGYCMGRCAAIYNLMCQLYPEYGLPNVKFADIGGTNIEIEQCKALPGEVRTTVAATLAKMPENGCTVGITLMMTAGLRTSEAAAPTFKEIQLYGDYGVLPVLRQRAEYTLSGDLKSPAAYRMVVLPKIAVDIVRDRINYLSRQGYSSDEIADMPCVAKNNDEKSPVSSQTLSAFGRKLLEICGCSSNHFRGVIMLQRIEPDTPDANGKQPDLTAYVFRRDWATRACNVCGLSMDTVDYLLGHKNSDTAGKDYLAPERQRQIAEKLERYVFLPEHSCNPAFAPHTVSTSNNKTLSGNNKHRFVADCDAVVTLTLSGMEANDTMTVSVPEDADVAITRADIVDAHEERRARQIIGVTRDADYYNSLIEQAYMLDTSHL